MSLPALLVFAILNSCIELEIAAPSFPEIMAYFQVSENIVGLTITYNLIGFCIASTIYGPLSEYYGRRKIMVIGNIILAIGAFGCAIAFSIKFLLFSRFIQGIGAATTAVLLSAIIADSYNSRKATKLYGIMNAFITTIMAMAPILGAIITMYIGWRGNYSFVAFICITASILLYFYLPETLKKANRSKRLEFMLVIKDYRKLITSPLFISATIVPSLTYCGYLSFVSVAPFIYMNEFELSLIQYTLHQASAVFCFSITSIFAGKIIDFFSTKKAIIGAIFLSLLGSLFALLKINIYMFTLSISIISIGSALIYPIIFAASLEIFPEIKGTASSAIMSIRYLICSIITGLTIYLYNGDYLTFSKIMLTITIIITFLSYYILQRIEL